MFTTACPSCGAQVEFRSPASVMAVCGYCKTTLLRGADAVRDIGKMSETLEDYSPIQIGVSGVHEQRPFGVVGRIQLRYDDGCWNEWYLFFEDGGNGWLSDASGQYTLTLDQGTVAAPVFDSLRPGQVFNHAGAAFTASDVRTAHCTGGAGELPFQVGAGWQARVADFRAGDRFLTLDYSDGEPPRVFLGKAANLVGLKCQLLRSDDDITRTAGRLRGAIASLACPGCSGPLAYPAGVATQLVCPACGTSTDVTGDRPTVLAKGHEVATLASTLALGDQAKIDGKTYLLIGLMRCQESGETSTWTEYLLYNTERGFLWLVESEEGWEQVRVLGQWPETSGNLLTLGQTRYKKLYDYGSEVVYAAGAFNWRVKVGDRTEITDWQATNGKLSQERNASEITWSMAQPVPPATLAGWFGKPAVQGLATPAAGSASQSSLAKPAIIYSIILLLFNLPIAFTGDDANWTVLILALGLIWWPVLSQKKE
jgi:hypothetical protein